MLKGQARAVAGKLLHTLADYTRDHFASEESAMGAAKYPALATHSLMPQAIDQASEAM